jgi:hypothetical protein
LHDTSSCKAISQTTLMLPHWQQSLALVQHTHQAAVQTVAGVRQHSVSALQQASCGVCRLIFSRFVRGGRHAKHVAAEQLDFACNDDNEYGCGSQLFPAGHKLDEEVYCNHSLTCSSLVESNLYKANSSTLNKLADSFAVPLYSSCGIEHLAPERSEQLGCNQTLL